MLQHKELTSGARARVLRQLCEALLCEGWASEVLIERSRSVSWSLGSVPFRAGGRLGAFGRYRLTEGTIETRAGAKWHPATIQDVLTAVAPASAAMSVLADDLAHTIHLTDLTTSQINKPARRSTLPLPMMESALHEGHPYHPCFKARSGFTDDDHFAYGPEAARQFRLVGVMIDRSLVIENLPAPDFWAQELGADEWHRIQKIADQNALPSDRFSLLPLHPWQWQQLQDDPLIQQWADAGQLAEIGPIGDHYTATQSVRTLMNADHPERAHVKTAMAMRNTSSLRTIIPATVAVAPAISKWLADVIASDPVLQNTYPLQILPEYASIIAGRDTRLAGHLAVIWRRSPEALGWRSDQMVPFNALALVETDGAPFIADWIAAHDLGSWVAQLIKVAVLPIWHLVVAHGIGLEAHGQNLILLHDNGWPTGIIIRDFHDSVEYCEDLLSRPDLRPDLGEIDPVYRDAPLDEYHELSSSDGLRELVMDTLFVFNLADLSNLLAQHFDFDEQTFWDVVRAQLDSYAQTHDMAARQDRLAPFAARIHAESLITRKIEPERDIYRHQIANALHTAKDHKHVCSE